MSHSYVVINYVLVRSRSDQSAKRMAKNLRKTLQVLGLFGEINIFEDTRGLWTTVDFIYHPTTRDIRSGRFRQHLRGLREIKKAMNMFDGAIITISPPQGDFLTSASHYSRFDDC